MRLGPADVFKLTNRVTEGLLEIFTKRDRVDWLEFSSMSSLKSLLPHSSALLEPMVVR